MQSAECRVSRPKALITVLGVANAQKQGVMGARPVLASSTTMFQELVQSYPFLMGELSSECETEGL